MASTTPDNIWIPDSDTPMVLDTMFANLASSLQNGIGARVKKLESFVGCYLISNGIIDIPSGASTIPITSLSVGGLGTFASGVTVTNGAVVIETPGIYNIQSNVSIQKVAAGSATALMQVSLAYNGNGVNLTYANTRQVDSWPTTVAAGAILNLKVGDTISMRVRSDGYDQSVRATPATNLAISLASRA